MGERAPAPRVNTLGKSRAAATALFSAALLATAALTGCSAVSTLTSTPTITDVTPVPGEITPTATPGSLSDPSTESPATQETTEDVPSSGRVADGPTSSERLVLVADLDVAFAAPVLFTSVDTEGLLEQVGGAAALDGMAESMGTTPAQLRNALSKQADQLLFGPAEAGFQTNILVSRSPLPILPTASQLRSQLGAVPGVKKLDVETIATSAGPGVIASYSVALRGLSVHGEIVLVQTADQVVSLTASSASAKTASALAERIVATIRPSS